MASVKPFEAWLLRCHACENKKVLVVRKVSMSSCPEQTLLLRSYACDNKQSEVEYVEVSD